MPQAWVPEPVVINTVHVGWVYAQCQPPFTLSIPSNRLKAGSLKMNTALEYSTRVVQEGGRRCKKSTLNDLVHLTPLRIPLMNPPIGKVGKVGTDGR